MSTVINRTEPILPEIPVARRLLELWPVIAPMLGAVVLILARLNLGRTGVLYEGALTMLALICYMSAAVLMVTNLFVRVDLLNRLGLLSLALGVGFNFSGWMIRWMEAGDAESWRGGINGVWRYFPLDNLYSLTLGFCFGAGITALIVARRPRYEFVGALSMPIVTVILTIAMLLGNDISTLPPILDSYWRPIHVSVATIAYGVCLVSFGLAFAYLLKDGIRSEAIAIATSLFGLLVYVSVGRSAIPAHAEYGASLIVDKAPMPIRAVLPAVGPVMTAVFVLLALSLALFVIDWLKRDEKARLWGWRAFRVAAVAQAVALVVLFYQIKNVDGLLSRIPDREYPAFGQWLARQMEATVPASKQAELARNWIQQNAAGLSLSYKSNPVEIGGLIALFVALLLVALIAWRRDRVVSAMPPLETIDSLLYRTVSVAFPLLTLLLITGAVWANESWGRYWGWDSKEVGALVSWIAYAAFLHTRVSHGWRGRRSAYFALLGFALVVFTWLGVSYLLPGLHSYA